MITFCQDRTRKTDGWGFLKYSCIFLLPLFSLSACATTGTNDELSKQARVAPIEVATKAAVSKFDSKAPSTRFVVPTPKVASTSVPSQTQSVTPASAVASSLLKSSPAQIVLSSVAAGSTQACKIQASSAIVASLQQVPIPEVINLAECTAGLNGSLLTVRAGDIFLYDNGMKTDVKPSQGVALAAGAMPAPSAGAQPEVNVLSPTVFLNSGDNTTQVLLMSAYQQTGRPFKAGGKAPEVGFDAEGFTQWVYAQKRIKLPKSVTDQATGGRQVVREELRPGDILVYQETAQQGDGYHVGIYTGQGNFLHVTAKTGVVTETAAFGPQFLPYFVSGRRYYDDPKASPLSEGQKMAATSKGVKLALAELGPNDKLKRPKIVPRKKSRTKSKGK